MNMTVGSNNFVKFTVRKPNCQKHSGCVFASGKRAMYPSLYLVIAALPMFIHSFKHYNNTFSDEKKDFYYVFIINKVNCRY